MDSAGGLGLKPIPLGSGEGTTSRNFKTFEQKMAQAMARMSGVDRLIWFKFARQL